MAAKPANPQNLQFWIPQSKQLRPPHGSEEGLLHRMSVVVGSVQPHYSTTKYVFSRGRCRCSGSFGSSNTLRDTLCPWRLLFSIREEDDLHMSSGCDIWTYPLNRSLVLQSNYIFLLHPPWWSSYPDWCRGFSCCWSWTWSRRTWSGHRLTSSTTRGLNWSTRILFPPCKWRHTWYLARTSSQPGFCRNKNHQLQFLLPS